MIAAAGLAAPAAAVAHHAVAEADQDIRLDRWFRRYFPALSHGRLEKLLRTGQIRVDGKRARASQRLAAGQTVRVPPLPPDDGASSERPAAAADAISDRDADFVASLVLHRDPSVLVLAKPAGLAVQGGSGVRQHLDRLLGALAAPGGDRPRLVHRLDRDTSGVLVLGRSARAAARLAAAFRGRDAVKLYWAVVVGRPQPPAGRIDQSLAKRSGASGRERMAPADAAEAQRAVTDYWTLDAVGRCAAWLALRPLTGRTHQLRAHAALLGTPILGDGKYGGSGAFLAGDAVTRGMHLHARRLVVAHPDGGVLDVTAPVPAAFSRTLATLGLAAADPDALVY